MSVTSYDYRSWKCSISQTGNIERESSRSCIIPVWNEINGKSSICYWECIPNGIWHFFSQKEWSSTPSQIISLFGGKIIMQISVIYIMSMGNCFSLINVESFWQNSGRQFTKGFHILWHLIILVPSCKPFFFTSLPHSTSASGLINVIHHSWQIVDERVT